MIKTKLVGFNPNPSQPLVSRNSFGMKIFGCQLFLFFFTVLHGARAEAQNIRNDTIFVSADAVTELRFADKCNANLPAGDKSYGVGDGGSKKSLIVKALKKGVKPQPLVIDEGSRKHYFILAYAEKPPLLVVNWSNLKDLKAHVQEKQNKANKLLDEANALYEKGHLREAWEQYNAVVNDVDDSKQNFVMSKKASIEKKIEGLFANAVQKGDQFFSDKQYKEAWASYKEAENWNDSAVAIKNFKEAKAFAFKDCIGKAKEATKKDDPEAVKYYEEAREIDSIAFRSQASVYQAVRNRLLEKLHRELLERGRNAEEMHDWSLALAAYDSACIMMPTNDICKTIGDRARQEIVNEANNRKKNQEYYGILSRAKRAAKDKDYNTAIEEYNKAGNLFPQRQFPKYKIEELRKSMNNPSARN